MRLGRKQKEILRKSSEVIHNSQLFYFKVFIFVNSLINNKYSLCIYLLYEARYTCICIQPRQQPDKLLTLAMSFLETVWQRRTANIHHKEQHPQKETWLFFPCKSSLLSRSDRFLPLDQIVCKTYLPPVVVIQQGLFNECISSLRVISILKHSNVWSTRKKGCCMLRSLPSSAVILKSAGNLCQTPITTLHPRQPQQDFISQTMGE